MRKFWRDRQWWFELSIGLVVGIGLTAAVLAMLGDRFENWMQYPIILITLVSMVAIPKYLSRKRY